MFKVIVKTEGLTNAEKAKVQAAAEHMQRCFNSGSFRRYVLNFSYLQQNYVPWWKRWFVKPSYQLIKHFHYTNMSNKQVLAKLLSGKEDLSRIEDGTANIFLKVDRRSYRGVIGYTYANTRWQWVYSWFLNSSNYRDLAANLAHEWCHKAGFGHEYRYTYLRQFSVPYAIGYFVGNWKV